MASNAVGNIHFIERPGKSAIEQRLSAKYLALLTRVYRYRRIGDFTHSCAAGRAADVVLARIANLHPERIAA
jgi:hypothetical protein